MVTWENKNERKDVIFCLAGIKSNGHHLRYHNYHHYLYQVNSFPNFAHITLNIPSFFSYLKKRTQSLLKCRAYYAVSYAVMETDTET